jgi:hypothetical protein
MAGETELVLTLQDFTPTTISMARLSLYMREFSALLGHIEHIHFLSLRDGSCNVAAYVDPVSEPKVEKRLFLLRTNAAPQEARNASKNIDDMLAEDNTAGSLSRNGAKIFDFPGRNRPKPEIIELARQRECIDGELVLIGGRDETVPVHLFDARQNKHFKCNTSKERAREMAPYLFGAELRVFGESEWKRDASGAWTMKTLWIEKFVVLKQEAVSETVKRLRAIPGNDWHKFSDPVAELLEIRYGSEVSN